MKKINEIDSAILKLKDDLQNVKGRQTEVYARIVGYYRSVKNWNKGKKEEYFFRTHFNPYKLSRDFNEKQTEVEKPSEKINSKVDSYLFFYRNTCPNCPPVKDALSRLVISGEHLNADDPANLEKALSYRVMSAPTVIFFDEFGNEVGRAFSKENIESLTPALCTN